MPGIDWQIVEHKIPIGPKIFPKKQKLRRLRPKWTEKVKEEIAKQIKAKFLEVIEYPTWLANMVLVAKKDGMVKVCIDFRDLNKVTCKHNFPLPHNNVLVNSASRAYMYSFRDGLSRYNQILMNVIDKFKTSFIIKWRTYCFKVMPSRLKNDGSAYQRAVTTLLHDLIHREMEVYLDDMLMKSSIPEEHPAVVDRFLSRIYKYNLRHNPKK